MNADRRANVVGLPKKVSVSAVQREAVAVSFDGFARLDSLKSICFRRSAFLQVVGPHINDSHQQVSACVFIAIVCQANMAVKESCKDRHAAAESLSPLLCLRTTN